MLEIPRNKQIIAKTVILTDYETYVVWNKMWQMYVFRKNWIDKKS